MYCTLQNRGALQSISGKTLSLSAGVNLVCFMASIERQQSVRTRGYDTLCLVSCASTTLMLAEVLISCTTKRMSS